MPAMFRSKFLIAFTLVSFGWILVIPGLNLLVDPLGVVTTAGYFTFDVRRPFAGDFNRLVKSHAISANKDSKGIYLSNSRGEYGIDPSSVVETSGYYNFSLSGAPLFEIGENLKFVTTATSATRVVLELPLEVFLWDRDTASSFDRDRLRFLETNIGVYSKDWRDLLLSASTFLKSLKTLAAQDQPSSISDRGYRIFETNGYSQRELFRRKLIATQNWLIGLSQKHDPFFLNKLNKSAFEILRNIVKLSYDRGIELTVVLSPQHVSYLKVVHVTGTWKIFQRYKTGIVETIESVASEYSKAPFDVIDFGTVNSATIVELPTPLYFDPSHYSPKLGELILRDVVAANNSKPLKIGRKLTSANIKRHLQAQTFALAPYLDP